MKRLPIILTGIFLLVLCACTPAAATPPTTVAAIPKATPTMAPKPQMTVVFSTPQPKFKLVLKGAVEAPSEKHKLGKLPEYKSEGTQAFVLVPPKSGVDFGKDRDVFINYTDFWAILNTDLGFTLEVAYAEFGQEKSLPFGFGCYEYTLTQEDDGVYLQIDPDPLGCAEGPVG